MMGDPEDAAMEPQRDAERPGEAEAATEPSPETGAPTAEAVVAEPESVESPGPMEIAGPEPVAEAAAAEPFLAALVPAPAPAVAAARAKAAEPVGTREGASAEEPDDGRRWYVVHCYSGYEGKVRHNLEQRVETMGMKGKIFDVVIPTEEEIEVKDGKRRTVERHVFPGYILVQMLMDEDSWYVVRNTPGVTGFVGMGNEPTPLRPEEVAQIIRRMEADAPRIKVTYKAGQRVRIVDGPFNDFIGTVDEIDMERAKVRVMVSFFGRETPVELDFLQVEKA